MKHRVYMYDGSWKYLTIPENWTFDSFDYLSSREVRPGIRLLDSFRGKKYGLVYLYNSRIDKSSGCAFCGIYGYELSDPFQGMMFESLTNEHEQ